MNDSKSNSADARYVVGFMFNEARNTVALIRKSKPDWQKGLLNGIGGKIEAGESAEFAMMREFCEESGATTHPGDWKHYCRLSGPDWRVEFFVTTGSVEGLKSMEEEPLEVLPIHDIALNRIDMVENLPWLIAAALDHLHDGRPVFLEATYP